MFSLNLTGPVILLEQIYLTGDDFISTTKRDDFGRAVIHLPRRQSHPERSARRQVIDEARTRSAMTAGMLDGSAGG
jgi:hypothetical protein